MPGLRGRRRLGHRLAQPLPMGIGAIVMILGCIFALWRTFSSRRCRHGSRRLPCLNTGEELRELSSADAASAAQIVDAMVNLLGVGSPTVTTSEAPYRAGRPRMERTTRASRRGFVAFETGCRYASGEGRAAERSGSIPSPG